MSEPIFVENALNELAAYKATGLSPEEVAKLKAERDAAIEDILQSCKTCALTSENASCPLPSKVMVCTAWQWRGLEVTK